MRHFFKVSRDDQGIPVGLEEATLASRPFERGRKLHETGRFSVNPWPQDFTPRKLENGNGFDVLEDRYVLGEYGKEKLGEGGMGEVYRCWDKKFCRFVAVKFISNDYTEVPDLASREAMISARAGLVAGTQAIAIQEYVQVANGHYLIFEYLDANSGWKTGVEWFLSAIEGNGLNASQLLVFLRQMCQTIDALAREEIFNLDIKLSNVMINTQTEDSRLLDFGIGIHKAPGVRRKKTLEHGAENLIVGTPGYLANERINTSVKLGTLQGEVFSLAVVFYELLTGDRLYDLSDMDGGSAAMHMYTQINEGHFPDVDGNSNLMHTISSQDKLALKSVLSRALTDNLLDRYKSGAEFFRAVEKILGRYARISTS